MSHPTPPVTRFAPSPTGMLHVGGARTALFAWAYARGRGGTFLLRLEDTDRKRSSEASAHAILADLEWLGLDWDNAGDVPTQSGRAAAGVYDAAIEQLKEKGLAYDDGEAVRFRQEKAVSFDDAVFGRVEYAAADLEDFVIRKADGFPTFHLAVVVDDAWQGVTHVIRGAEHLSNTPKHAALCDALGYDRPTWAHIPSIQNPDGSKMSKRDKAKAARKAAQEDMEDRGIELVPYVAWLREDLKDTPMYIPGATGPGTGGSAADDDFEGFLQKQNDDLSCAAWIAWKLDFTLPEIDVRDFWETGYLPAVLCNYLALLGWNPGGDVERFDLDFVKERFDFDRVQKGPAKFDREKLLAFNADTLQQMPTESFADLLIEHMRHRHPALLEKLEGHFTTFAEQYQPRSQTLEDPAKLGRFFVELPGEYDAKGAKKWLHKSEGAGLRALEDVKPKLEAIADAGWTPETIHATLEAFVAEQGMKNLGGIAQPLRMAITGTPVSPEIGPTLAILGKEETLRRIDACLAVEGERTATH